MGKKWDAVSAFLEIGIKMYKTYRWLREPRETKPYRLIGQKPVSSSSFLFDRFLRRDSDKTLRSKIEKAFPQHHPTLAETVIKRETLSQN